MDSINQKKHKGSRRANEEIKYSLLDCNTQKDEMENCANFRLRCDTMDERGVSTQRHDVVDKCAQWFETLRWHLSQCESSVQQPTEQHIVNTTFCGCYSHFNIHLYRIGLSRKLMSHASCLKHSNFLSVKVQSLATLSQSWSSVSRHPLRRL